MIQQANPAVLYIRQLMPALRINILITANVLFGAGFCSNLVVIIHRRLGRSWKVVSGGQRHVTVIWMIELNAANPAW